MGNTSSENVNGKHVGRHYFLAMLLPQYFLVCKVKARKTVQDYLQVTPAYFNTSYGRHLICFVSAVFTLFKEYP